MVHHAISFIFAIHFIQKGWFRDGRTTPWLWEWFGHPRFGMRGWTTFECLRVVRLPHGRPEGVVEPSLLARLGAIEVVQLSNSQPFFLFCCYDIQCNTLDFNPRKEMYLLQFSSDVCINCFVGFLEDNSSFEGERKAEGQRTGGRWSYLNFFLSKVLVVLLFVLHDCIVYYVLVSGYPSFTMATDTKMYLNWVSIRVGMIEFVTWVCSSILAYFFYCWFSWEL